MTPPLMTAYQQGFADGQLYAQGEIARLRRIVDLLLPALADVTEQELDLLFEEELAGQGQIREEEADTWAQEARELAERADQAEEQRDG